MQVFKSIHRMLVVADFPPKINKDCETEDIKAPHQSTGLCACCNR